MTTTSLKRAVVTGGTRGIGRAIVLDLSRRGYAVAFCYRSNAQEAETLCEQIRAEGGQATASQVDVSDFAAASAWIGSIEQHAGPIDLVVNSAGVVRDRSLVLMSEQDWSDVINTNLNGVFNVSKAVSFPMLRRKRGVIINMSSVAGVHGHATQSNYAASKAGIIGFSRSLAKEMGPYGIRVNTVAPGFIDTDMIGGVASDRLDSIVASMPLRRIGTVEDVAHLVGFLASDEASYITGQVIGVDGGLVT